jgi:hypothetical protein
MLRCSSAHRPGSSATVLPRGGGLLADAELADPQGKRVRTTPTTTPPAHFLVGVKWRAFFVSEWNSGAFTAAPPANRQTTHPTL